ncbi:MAG: hypothetical protein K9G26_04885 [Emcibacter sp.]|nr:hypothetical protein [Emcibacter sp.]
MVRYYEDLEIGRIVESKSAPLSEEEIIEFATKYDPQYFHIDPVAAKSSPFGGVIASGTHSIAHWSSLNNTICNDIRWICSVGWKDLCFFKGLLPNVPVYARAQCIEKRPSKSDSKRGVATFRFELLEENGDMVLSMLCTNLVETKNKE